MILPGSNLVYTLLLGMNADKTSICWSVYDSSAGDDRQKVESIDMDGFTSGA